MRFITEFEIKEEDDKDKGFRRVLLFNKTSNGQIEMGRMLAAQFGWENPVNGNPLHHRLEIEAFPMDKWVEFKRSIATLIMNNCDELSEDVIKLLNKLESFGKPSGDAIINLSDQIEYRGSNSHCKACEDEAAGIKHIKAQKHTCKK